jgi:hypothetical protein
MRRWVLGRHESRRSSPSLHVIFWGRLILTNSAPPCPSVRQCTLRAPPDVVMKRVTVTVHEEHEPESSALGRTDPRARKPATRPVS